jgi:hypothetical protein
LTSFSVLKFDKVFDFKVIYNFESE